MDAKTAAFHTEERLKRYMEAKQRNFSDAPNESGAVASSEEVEQFIEKAGEEAAVRKNYEKLKETVITVPSERVMPSDKGSISVEVDEGLVEGIGIIEFDSRSANISIKIDDNYVLEKPDGSRATITGEEALSKLKTEKSKSEQKEIVKTAGRR